MNVYGEENLCCYFHPKEVIVGVCALCLKERLLSLASKKQGRLPLPKDANKSIRVLRRKASIALPKVFTLGSFIHRFEPRTRKTEEKCGEGSLTSLEDSFISIKFEPDGCAAWESKRTARASVGPSVSWLPTGSEEGAVKEKSNSSRVKSVVEHPKMRGTLRWRKRIGQLLQLVRWKRSSKAGGASHAPGLAAAGNVEGIWGRRAWIRSLTRRRTTSTTV